MKVYNNVAGNYSDFFKIHSIYFFADMSLFYEEIAMIVGLGEIIKIDKSVLELADLPIGYHAVRDSRKDKWVICKTE